jgi:signal transduction histidine kinase
VLAFLAIGILSVAVIAVTARLYTRAEFIRFLSDQDQNDLVAQLALYHAETGSWDHVGSLFQRPSPSPNMGPMHMHMHPFTLTNENGIVIFSTDPEYIIGAQVSTAVLQAGTAITENREVIGVVLAPHIPFEGNPRELEFIARISGYLLYAALVGTVIALIVGTMLSRTFTRPIRELTHAAHAISAGDLAQEVPIRSKDELGELAQAFNRMSAQLLRSINTRKQMTADIAHELRTPLSLILGHAEAVHDGVLEPSRENFEIIREEATRLEQLINDLRTLSLADAGELPITTQIVEPERLINEIIALYQYQMQRKNISLHLDVAAPLSTLELDPGRMTQVFTNILDNALRYTPENGHIDLSARQFNQWVEFTIQDSGPGVPQDKLEHIFERFYRVDTSRQREDGGSGLGLAIAKSIIQAHNGELTAESEAGQGLRITIRLPEMS